MAPREESVGLIAKAVALLDQLAEDGELTAAQLSERLGEPRTTVYRLVGTLESLGLVEPGRRRGTYGLGVKLFRLGGAVVARFDERQAALPEMERLHDATGETVFLCIRRGDQAVCIERIEGSRAVSLALKLGGSLPLHAGAAARVLLAADPRSSWEAYARAGDLQRFTESTPCDEAELIPALEQVRRTGVSISDEDVTVGIAAVGAPVRNYRGEVTAALSLSGVRASILGEREDVTAGLVVAAADAISHALGYDPAAVVVAGDD